MHALIQHSGPAFRVTIEHWDRDPWLLGTPGVTAPIIGPRTLAQFDELIGATDLVLDDDERASLEAPAPPPAVYPQRMLVEQVGVGDYPPLRRPTTPTA